MKKKIIRLFSVFLAILLSFETGCAGNTGNIQTQQKFSDYTEQIFCSEVAASTLNMHYNLSRPEDYGITEYDVTYGSVSADTNEEAPVLLENWREKLRSFEKEELTVSQQMTYDIMMDFIDRKSVV